MVNDVFRQYHGNGNKYIFSIPRKTDTNILDKICNSNDWKICISCNFYQFYFCRTYNSYNFLLTRNCTYKNKSFYHRVTPDISPCSTGMAVPFHKLKCSVVDLSSYRDYRQYDRNINNIDFT